ncbi:GtrA family protein [Novosphingobium sp. MBES04]|uniref:GtrA family protein n=1 Tax=Novosphingobium sp. MBES04 TaxID=1206458 RepID=UPI00057DBA0A|nr:GtrA family protein [Novosphingobium sp. MBES04]
MIGQFARFAGVGLLGTLCHVIMATAFATLTGASPYVANFAGFLCAVCLSYLGHSRFTFDIARDDARYAPKFVVSALLSLLLSTGMTWLVHDRFGYAFWIAMLAIAIVVPVSTYLLLRTWVFAKRDLMDPAQCLGLLVSAAVAALILLTFWDRLIHHDVAWYLIATSKWIEGAHLYRDIIEVNPPLNFYFTLPVILISKLTGADPANSQYIFISIVAFTSINWCWSILKGAKQLTTAQRAVFLSLCAIAIFAPSLGDIAQRDQLLVILILPWLLGEMPSVGQVGRVARVARTICAALGICLKPHFVVIPMAVSGWHVVQQRSLRPLLSTSNVTFLISGLAYLAMVWLLHPEYFLEIVPAARLVYGAYGVDPKGILLSFGLLPLLILAGLTVSFVRKNRPADIGLLICASLAGLGSYLLQWTGYRYQAIPFIALSLISLSWAMVSVKGQVAQRVVFALIFAMVMVQSYHHGFYRNSLVQELEEDIRPGSTFFVFSTHVYAGPPVAVALKADWASRYPALWFVPGAVNAIENGSCPSEVPRCAALSELADQTRRDVMDDLAAARPRILVFDTTPGYITDPHFRWDKFMRKAPGFTAEMNHYRLKRTLPRFTIWERKEP